MPGIYDIYMCVCVCKIKYLYIVFVNFPDEYVYIVSLGDVEAVHH